MSERLVHLETAFSNIPSKIGSLELRPLSAGSFTLLARLGNPMVPSNGAAVSEDNRTDLFEAVIQYAYLHSAPMEEIAKIGKVGDIDESKLKMLGFDLKMSDVFAFLQDFQAATERMAANLAEIDPEDEKDKPGKSALLPVGSPASSTPAEPVVIPSVSDTSSGSCPSNGPLPTSTLPTSPTEQPAGGLVMLPDLATAKSEMPQSVSTPPYNAAP